MAIAAVHRWTLAASSWSPSRAARIFPLGVFRICRSIGREFFSPFLPESETDEKTPEPKKVNG
jgi:hypothetical protein